MKPTLPAMIAALRRRGWSRLEAEDAAERVVGFWQAGTAPWAVRHTREPAMYEVARKENEVAVYESATAPRSEAVRDALNDIEMESA